LQKWGLALLAALLLVTLLIVKLWPDEDDIHIHNEFCGHLSDSGGVVSVNKNITIPYYRMINDVSVPLSDYGINSDDSFVTGNKTLDGNAYYALIDGNLYIIDAFVIEELLTLLDTRYIPDLWHGELGDRPALTEISLLAPLYPPSFTSVRKGYTIIRNELDDSAPLGLSRFELVYPFSHVCNDDSVRVKVLSGINSMDLDEIADDVQLLPESCHTLKLKAAGFEQTIYIGEAAPCGGRYLMLEGDDTVYIDKLGDYGFLDIMPLDLTFGLPFWLYRIEDVERITVTDDGQLRTLPENISDMSWRRFFAHVLSFTVAGMAADYGDFDNKITLYMNDGSMRELRFARQNERQLAVSVDGKEPIFVCSIRDWQQIIESMDTLDAGRGI
jgi:hypothetical protein